MMKNTLLATALLLSGLLAMPAQADDDEAELLATVKDYLIISDQYVQLIKEKEAALFFAVEGIVEIHEERGEQAKAIPYLRSILDKYPNNQTIRNIVRLKLRDVYGETGRADLALNELEAVIEENR